MSVSVLFQWIIFIQILPFLVWAEPQRAMPYTEEEILQEFVARYQLGKADLVKRILTRGVAVPLSLDLRNKLKRQGLNDKDVFDAMAANCKGSACDWAVLKESTDPGKLRRFASKYTGTPEAKLALARAGKLERESLCTSEWSRLKDSNDPRVLRDFAGQCQEGPESSKALARVETLEHQSQCTAEWMRLNDSKDPRRLRDFAGQCRESPESSKALARAETLERQSRCTAEWTRLKDSNDPSGLRDFAGQCQESLESSKALARAETLERQSRCTSEWSRLKDSNDPRVLRDFAGQCQEGPESSKALARVETLERQSRCTAEWTRLKDSNNSRELRAFAGQCPEYPESSPALARAERIDRWKSVEGIWSDTAPQKVACFGSDDCRPANVVASLSIVPATGSFRGEWQETIAGFYAEPVYVNASFKLQVEGDKMAGYADSARYRSGSGAWNDLPLNKITCSWLPQEGASPALLCSINWKGVTSGEIPMSSGGILRRNR